MQQRQLGRSGLMVPALSFGSATFGGGDGIFDAWGGADQKQANRLIDICLDHGVNFFDSANVYSGGAAELILGEAVREKRDEVLLSTKIGLTSGLGSNETGSSRFNLTRALDASLDRLHTEYVDVLYVHGFDALTPIEEMLGTLEGFVAQGKVRYIGCSNFSAWHVMKAQAVAQHQGWPPLVAYQGYYSLAGREYEDELAPVCHDQGLGTVVWSPLSWGRLSGKFRRGHTFEGGRIALGGDLGAPPLADERLFAIVDALSAVAEESGRTIAQVALNWLLQQPTVSSVVLGARTEKQLIENLGAADWALTTEQLETLGAASERELPYPYWHQRQLTPDRIPAPPATYPLRRALANEGAR